MQQMSEETSLTELDEKGKACWANANQRVRLSLFRKNSYHEWKESCQGEMDSLTVNSTQDTDLVLVQVRGTPASCRPGTSER